MKQRQRETEKGKITNHNSHMIHKLLLSRERRHRSVQRLPDQDVDATARVFEVVREVLGIGDVPGADHAHVGIPEGVGIVFTEALVFIIVGARLDFGSGLGEGDGGGEGREGGGEDGERWEEMHLCGLVALLLLAMADWTEECWTGEAG